MADRTRVLLAYATADGSTAGVAEHMAEALRSAGHDVTCTAAGPDLDPADFDAFIVGSAVHNMAWLPPALDLLARLPAAAPLWCFSVAGADPRGFLRSRLAQAEGRRVAAGFPGAARPVDHRVFGGVVATTGVPLWGRLFYLVVGQRGGDNRDWPEIARWAAGIADTLSAVPSRQPGERP
jgi:menaquinone-dependent protoporphyrinogen oxidase